VQNKRKFVPNVWTHGVRKGGVVPDATFPVQTLGWGGGVYYDSGFVEVKAMAPGVMWSSSFDYQLQTMVDVASESPGAKAGRPGEIIFVTTAGVTAGSDLILNASARRVAIWHAEVLESSQGVPGQNNLRVGYTLLLNPAAYAVGFPISTVIPPKAPGGLRPLSDD
jgi:hypothetical protein